MSYIEKEKLIKADIASIENRVRHAFNQGYDLGFKDGKEKAKPLEQEPTTKNGISNRSIIYGDNCISRQAVIDMTGLSEWFDSSDSYNEFVIALGTLPSVTPQPMVVPIAEVKIDEDKFKELANRAVLSVIPQEPILDKIRAEIKSLERFEIRGEKTPLINGNNVLAILDKYKAESGVKDADSN